MDIQGKITIFFLILLIIVIVTVVMPVLANKHNQPGNKAVMDMKPKPVSTSPKIFFSRRSREGFLAGIVSNADPSLYQLRIQVGGKTYDSLPIEANGTWQLDNIYLDSKRIIADLIQIETNTSVDQAIIPHFNFQQNKKRRES